MVNEERETGTRREEDWGRRGGKKELSIFGRQLLLSLGLPVAKTRDWGRAKNDEGGGGQGEEKTIFSPPPRPQSSSLLVPVSLSSFTTGNPIIGVIKGVACGGG